MDLPQSLVSKVRSSQHEDTKGILSVRTGRVGTEHSRAKPFLSNFPHGASQHMLLHCMLSCTLGIFSMSNATFSRAQLCIYSRQDLSLCTLCNQESKRVLAPRFSPHLPGRINGTSRQQNGHAAKQDMHDSEAYPEGVNLLPGKKGSPKSPNPGFSGLRGLAARIVCPKVASTTPADDRPASQAMILVMLCMFQDRAWLVDKFADTYCGSVGGRIRTSMREYP